MPWRRADGLQVGWSLELVEGLDGEQAFFSPPPR